MSIFWACFACSYADEKISSSDNTRFFISFSSGSLISHGSPSLLSFEALSDLCVQVNDDLANGVFGSSRKNISCKLSSFSVGGEAYWGISLANSNLTNFWYCNGSLGVFYSRANTDSLLSLISNYVSSIPSKLSTVTDRLSTLTNDVASIYTKLSSIDDSVLIGTGTLNNIYNYLTGDLTTYLQDIDISVGNSETFLGQISTKMDSVVNTLTTESGKNSLFYPITQRLDTIIDRIVPAYSHPFSHRGWCLSGDDMSSLSVSDVGYNALSSMMETVTEEYLSYHFFDGAYHIDVLDSLSIVHATVGGNTGYFIRGTGTLSKSVNGINEFYEDQTFYLGESNNTLFYASDASRASAGASVSLSSDALYTNFGTIGQLAQACQDGTLDPSTTFPTLNAVVVGLLGLAQKIDAVDLNPKVEVVVKEAEYTVNHFTDVVVDSSSDIYNVFYLTDEDGNQTSVGRVAADSLGASGKLLQFLFRFCVDGALSGVDGSMDSLTDFYFDNAESSLGEGVSIWD